MIQSTLQELHGLVNDIGYFLQKSQIVQLSVHELREALTNHWKPIDEDQCPTSYDKHVKCERRVSLQLLNDEKWLAVSQVGIYKGLWCSTCALMRTSDYGEEKEPIMLEVEVKN